ncbi:MAG: hypothetical protein RL062_678, partial [Bacteroidota bacterium]
MKKYWIISLSILCAWVGMSLIFSSCQKNVQTGANDSLDYSTDTLFFDTVFTSIGSTTQIVKIYNHNEAAMHIDKINLRGGSSSMFRMAADGDNGTSFSDIDLNSGDSLYIFVEVTIDPNDETF